MSGAGPDSPLFGASYAIAAYVVIFATLFGYLGAMHVAQRRLRRRIERLEAQIERIQR